MAWKYVKMDFPGLGVNTKVVDIDKNYLNMENEQNPMLRYAEKLKFLIKNCL